MGKVKKFFSDINKSKFKSLYVKNFLFAVSILIVVLFGFSYLTFNVRAIEQNKLYEEVTGVITGYKEKAKADVLTPRLISEECSFIVETDNEKTYEILLPRLELKTRGILLQEGGPKYWIGKQITFYYRDDPSKPFHYDINERKAGSKDGKENPEI